MKQSFKPYYKWITFNISPSCETVPLSTISFKPYYKWITFNILTEGLDIVFIIERISFYMVAKFEHFSVF